MIRATRVIAHAARARRSRTTRAATPQNASSCPALATRSHEPGRQRTNRGLQAIDVTPQEHLIVCTNFPTYFNLPNVSQYSKMCMGWCNSRVVRAENDCNIVTLRPKERSRFLEPPGCSAGVWRSREMCIRCGDTFAVDRCAVDRPASSEKSAVKLSKHGTRCRNTRDVRRLRVYLCSGGGCRLSVLRQVSYNSVCMT